jgi:hypothetical protein
MGFDPSKVGEMSDEELLRSLGSWTTGSPQYVICKIEHDLRQRRRERRDKVLFLVLGGIIGAVFTALGALLVKLIG